MASGARARDRIRRVERGEPVRRCWTSPCSRLATWRCSPGAIDWWIDHPHELAVWGGRYAEHAKGRLFGRGVGREVPSPWSVRPSPTRRPRPGVGLAAVHSNAMSWSTCSSVVAQLGAQAHHRMLVVGLLHEAHAYMGLQPFDGRMVQGDEDLVSSAPRRSVCSRARAAPRGSGPPAVVRVWLRCAGTGHR